ncbi:MULTISPECIES: LptF/LptG family permease [unclassified Candidatus Frackibacter]|uniref:LptF/LptG family permease n=1 Tax=unclassified Candidatus Frackibacter TaxID=2648818 RepID=UPI00088B4659|nr:MULTISPECIES: LptF/LptG family permease [unclassified Candidatus Frackibacter]SDC31098.1 LPS export ABC transporter permease LptF/LPS export ABC transporter permease LptG,TIGR04408 [Candidatus Frackibacter sp. WG11]SEM73706.1 LPS export ABC transporter permease LptF/LPS export ABC transporter permease LptG,TIGR04408 [Candidatus Frackibacter sp. WG12]SFL58966.1 LPS export ABC transporter permease LptF/LPS export ABC transporter permease LptG,TIGR04408 [Candidatus Frackibacter sp. WG13]
MKFCRQLKIIDLYIVKEVLLPFLVGIAIIGVIMLSNFLFQLTDMIIVKDIPVLIVIKLLGYKLPAIIVRTLPIATLLAVMIGVGRLSKDSEFIALQMGGVSLFRFIIPLLVLGILISGTTYFFNEKIVPWSNHQAQNIIRRSILSETIYGIEDNVFFKGPKSRLFYIKEYDRKNSILRKPVIFDYSKQDNYLKIITAKKANIAENTWKLKQGIIHDYDKNGELTLETQFDIMEIEMGNRMDKLVTNQKTTSEMSRAELKEEIELFKSSGLKVDSLLIDYHLKLSKPFIALIFILIGTPLSLNNKKSRAVNIVLTIVIIFLYYLILSLTRSFGKNGFLIPVLTSWLPNIIFSLIGAVLLFWKNSWKESISKLIPVSLIIISFIFLSTPGVQAEKLKIKADQLRVKGNKTILKNDIAAKYKAYHVLADKVIIKENDNEKIETSKVIEISQTKLSGCELDKPHYFFKSPEVIIYPGDHIEAKHVTFWELNGRLPLMYWPYLYISLKDKASHLETRLGHSAKRGWFIKNTYSYWYDKSLPGELYLDYYNISGLAGGFKQYFTYTPKQEGSVYLYSQKNKTGIPGLWNWQGKIDYSHKGEIWRANTDIDYTDYDDYKKAFSRINLNHNSQKQDLDLNFQYDSKDYFKSSANDDQELDLDFKYQYKFLEDWKLNLDYNRDYLLEAKQDLKSRWGGKGYLTKRSNNFNFKLTLERYDPNFDLEESSFDLEDEDDKPKVRFYRWPEITIKYFPQASILKNINFKTSLGKYYEASSDIEGYRGLGEINYNKRFNLLNNISLQVNQKLNGKLYKQINGKEDSDYYYLYDPKFRYDYYQNSYSIKLKLNTSFLDHIDWNTEFEYKTFTGESPFNFDQASYKQEIESDLKLYNDNFSLQLNGGYDLYNASYLPLGFIINWEVTPNWRLNAGSTFNINSKTYGDLAINSKYKSKHIKFNTALKHDLNNNQLQRWESKFTYKLQDQLYLELNNRYDFEAETVSKANLILKKRFHRREIWLTYKHEQREIMLEYRLDIFNRGVKVGSNQDEGFMYDLGIKEILEEE